MPSYRQTTRSRDKLKPLQCLLKRFPPKPISHYTKCITRVAAIWDGYRYPMIPYSVHGIGEAFMMARTIWGDVIVMTHWPPDKPDEIESVWWHGEVGDPWTRWLKIRVDEPNDAHLGLITLSAMERQAGLEVELDYADQHQYIQSWAPLEFMPTLFMDHRAGHTTLFAQAIHPGLEIDRSWKHG